MPRNGQNGYNQITDQQRVLRLSYTYTYGATAMTKSELRAAKKAAAADQELRGRVREAVLARYDDLIGRR